MALEILAAGTVPAETPSGEPAGTVEIHVVGLPVHNFSEAEMEAAFALVSPAEHWKAPIAAEIPVEMREVVAEAIAYYTASEAVFAEAGPGRLHVTAAGYWAGPAGS
jgi:hypothetical protein